MNAKRRRRETSAGANQSAIPAQASPQGKSWSRRSLAVLLLLAFVVVLLVVWNSWRGPRLAAVPEVALNEAGVAVAGAVRRAQAAVVAAPRSDSAWGQLGMTLLAHQFNSEAELCFEQAATLNDESFSWHYLLGVSRSVLDPEGAQLSFRRALALRPQVAATYLRLGELLIPASQFDEASGCLQQALKLDPDDPRVHFLIGQLLVAQDQYQSALPWAEHATRLAPNARPPHELLARICRRLGDADRAVGESQRATDATEPGLPWRDPITGDVLALRQDTAARRERADRLRDADRPQEAAGLLRETWRDDQRDPRVATTLCELLLSLDQLDEAAAVIAAARSRHPNSAEVCFQSGNVAFMRQDWKAAADSFEAAIRLQPAYPLAHYNLGHTRWKQGRREEALQSFRGAVKYRPEYWDARANIARILHELGRTPAAISELEATLREAPDHPLAQQLLREYTSTR